MPWTSLDIRVWTSPCPSRFTDFQDGTFKMNFDSSSTRIYSQDEGLGSVPLMFGDFFFFLVLWDYLRKTFSHAPNMVHHRRDAFKCKHPGWVTDKKIRAVE